MKNYYYNDISDVMRNGFKGRSKGWAWVGSRRFKIGVSPGESAFRVGLLFPSKDAPVHR